jgi:predicted DNA-binding protein (MmcQ/YjbR family)
MTMTPRGLVAIEMTARESLGTSGVIDRKMLRAYCAEKAGATESYPFDEATLVFKVMGKMFALMPFGPYEANDHDGPPRINLKCEPALAEVLRNTYDAVQPGYHMDKRHWNTVIVDGSIPADEIYEMIDHSYDLVVGSLKKADRELLGARLGQAQAKAKSQNKGKK